MTRPPRPKGWRLIPVLPLFIGIVGWASGQLWLTWLALPMGLVAVVYVLRIETSSPPAAAPTPAASPEAMENVSSVSACVGLAVDDWGEVAELVRAVAPRESCSGRPGESRWCAGRIRAAQGW